MLTPPTLPHFLSIFNLKDIQGVPTDEEVKLLHATIRSLNDVIQVPGLYDPDLAMRLSEYLFSVQMERYRDKYPCIIFPPNTTYTPPHLPAQIQVKLEPITGAPSDEQIKSVQTALRMSESLASVSSTFSEDLSMHLSQHLFDVQFERYLRRIANREYGIPPVDSHKTAIVMRHPQDTSDASESPRTQNVQNKGHHDASNIPPTSAPPQPSPRALSFQSEVGSLQSQTSTLKLFIHSMARAMNGSYHAGEGYAMYSNSLLNAKGETPESVGLPGTTQASGKIGRIAGTDGDLARYLRFYGIGEEYILDDGQLTIKEGSRDAAKAILRSHLGYSSPHVYMW